MKSTSTTISGYMHIYTFFFLKITEGFQGRLLSHITLQKPDRILGKEFVIRYTKRPGAYIDKFKMTWKREYYILFSSVIWMFTSAFYLPVFRKHKFWLTTRYFSLLIRDVCMRC